MTRDEAIRIAERIAAGHAFDKHVVEREELPGISTREEFEALILEALTHPDEERKLERGRHAYWSARYSAIIIVDEGSESNGTAFRPLHGVEYLRSGLQ